MNILKTVKLPAREGGSFQLLEKKHENKFRRDLVGYLDFECELREVKDKCNLRLTVRRKCDQSYTRNE